MGLKWTQDGLDALMEIELRAASEMNTHKPAGDRSCHRMADGLSYVDCKNCERLGPTGDGPVKSLPWVRRPVIWLVIVSASGRSLVVVPDLAMGYRPTTARQYAAPGPRGPGRRAVNHREV